MFYENGDGSRILLYSFFGGYSCTLNQVVPNTLTSGAPALAIQNGKLHCSQSGASWSSDDKQNERNGQPWFGRIRWSKLAPRSKGPEHVPQLSSICYQL